MKETAIKMSSLFLCRFLAVLMFLQPYICHFIAFYAENINL